MSDFRSASDRPLPLASGRYGIVAARFNEHLVAHLVEGCKSELCRCGILENQIDVVWVPGSFELPLMAQRLAATGRFAAIVCLGCIIRGETDHYQYVCEAATHGILQAGLKTGVPIIFGVLTCATEQQAMARCGGSHGHKGIDAARAALDMAAALSAWPLK
jgi:6,7-dimethyl-8-ribityllumazine synthase